MPKRDARAEQTEASATLLVGPKTDFRDAIEQMLAEIGYSVAALESGADALDALCTGQYRVCLLDFDVEDVEGEQFVKLAKNLSPWLQMIVAYPADSRMSALLNVLRYGVCDVFSKEESHEEVAVAVGAAIARFDRWRRMLSSRSKPQSTTRKAKHA